MCVWCLVWIKSLNWSKEVSHWIENVWMLLNGQSLYAAYKCWFHCFVLAYYKIDIIHSPELLCTIFRHFSQCWNTRSPNTKTEWRYLLAVDIGFFFHPELPQLWQHKASSHKNTHTHYRLLFGESKCAALPGLSNVANMALFFPLQQTAIRAAFCQPSFWYLYFHRILITLCLRFFVSPFFHACYSLRSCCFNNVISRCWPFVFFYAHVSFWVLNIPAFRKEEKSSVTWTDYLDTFSSSSQEMKH